MADLIERGAAIAAIEQARQAFALPDDVPGSRMVNAGFAAAHGALEKIPPAPHWISVKEQLPEEGEFIVTFNKYQNETFSFATFSMGTFNLFGLFPLSPYTVTHWYPLPAPPVD